MQNPLHTDFRKLHFPSKSGFTLMETVIAIGVLAVLLTGFIAVFTPAAQGIRRSISSQNADRLTTALQNELVTLRKNQDSPEPKTGFEKGFTWLLNGKDATKAIFVYQYRGNPAVPLRSDGTPEAYPKITGQPGTDYIVQSMARRVDDANFKKDLTAIEGSVFFVIPTQLITTSANMTKNSNPGITNQTPLPVRVPVYPSNPTKADDYADAVISFSAEFHSVPTKAVSYLTGSAFGTRFNEAMKVNPTIKPIFTRNLAIRR